MHHRSLNGDQLAHGRVVALGDALGERPVIMIPLIPELLVGPDEEVMKEALPVPMEPTREVGGPAVRVQFYLHAWEGEE